MSEKKAWEEEWIGEVWEEYHEGEVWKPARIKRADGSDVLEWDARVDGCWMTPEDLKLAAEAPAMARLLLEIGARCLASTEQPGCECRGCRITTTLRAAGVIP